MKSKLYLVLAFILSAMLFTFTANAGEVYEKDGMKTAYVASAMTVDIDGNTYNTYQGLTTAIAAFGGNEGKIIIATDVTEETFTDTKSRGKVTIEGLTGEEVYTLSGGSVTFTGNTCIDNVKFILPWCYFTAGGGLYLGENYIQENIKAVYFDSGTLPSRNIIYGGLFNTFNIAGTYRSIPAGSTVYVEVGGNANIASINLGYGEKNTTTTIAGNITFVLNADVVTSKVINYHTTKSPDGTAANYTVILNNDLGDIYSLDENATAVVDYLIKSTSDGKVELYSDGTTPTLKLIPNDGLVPVVNGAEVFADSNGAYLYTPSASGTYNVTYKEYVEDSGIYDIDGVTTVFVASSASVEIDGTVRKAFQGLTTAIAALERKEGKVIIASNVTEETFTDTKNRGKVTIEGLTGKEVYTLSGGSVTFTGNTSIDNVKFILPWCYFTAGGGLYLGENYTQENIKAVYFDSGTLPSRNIIHGGQFSSFNIAGTYRSIPEDSSVYAEIGRNAKISAVNLGYGEKNANTEIKGKLTLVINDDVVEYKNITYNKAKSPDGTAAIYTVILNNGMSDIYSLDDDAKAVVDYLVFSENGGKTTVYNYGEDNGLPVLQLVPEEGKVPFIDGLAISEKNGMYTYELPTVSALTEVYVTWEDDHSDAVPETFTYNGKKSAIVKSGMGSVTFDGETRNTFPDINSATSALGTDGGYIFIYGKTEFISGEPKDTNVFADIEGRNPLNIIGIENTDAGIVYYKSMYLKGDLTMDSLTFHRLNGTIYDTGVITYGHDLTLGYSFRTVSDFAKQNMAIHISEGNLTFDGGSSITVNGGDISRISAGTTYNAGTVNGSTVINIGGNANIGSVFAGSHGGASGDSITSGDVTINITGGTVKAVYTGSNTKTGVQGNVTVNISGGNLENAILCHGAHSTASGMYVDGNSVFNIRGGILDGAVLKTNINTDISGAKIFVVSDSVNGYTYNDSDNDVLVVYDAKDGEVYAHFDENGEHIGYEIISKDSDSTFIIDGEITERTDDDIYTIDGYGKHTVMFSYIFTLTFDANGAEGTVPAPKGYFDGTMIELPDDCDLEYYTFEFCGWNTDRNAKEGLAEFVMPSRDTTLYAVWMGIKPEISDQMSAVSNGVSYIITTPILPESYDTNEYIIDICDHAEKDPSLLNGFETVYAFELSAYDADDNAVSYFKNGIDLRIPKKLLGELSVGEGFEIRSSDGESVEKYAVKSDDEYTYITVYSSGVFAITKTFSKAALYTYTGKYDAENGKYMLSLGFSGASAGFGSFGIKYDTEKLALDSFKFSDRVVSAGSAYDSMNFGTYYNSDGIYRNTWLAVNNGHIDAETSPVVIGNLVFTVAQGCDLSEALAKDLFDVSLPEETGFVPGEAVELSSIVDGGYYMYSPHIASTEVNYQPINTVFAEKSKSNLSLNYELVREYGNTYLYEEGKYDARAVITVTDVGGTVVATKLESDCTFSESENGKVIVTAEFALPIGTYSISFVKNGYKTHIVEVTITESENKTELISLMAGDIKNTYEELCGDGLVDIDDFIRVIRGFDTNASEMLTKVVDITEDGIVSVIDIAIIKANFVK